MRFGPVLTIRRLSVIFCLTVAFACTPTEGGGDTDSSTGGTETSTGDSDTSTGDTDDTNDTNDTTGDTGESGPAAIAFLRSQRPELADEGEADDLLVDIADFELLCADPDEYPACSDEAFWRLSLTFAADEQQPGSYAAADLGAVILSQSSIDSPCESAAFEFDGTIEIISIDGTELLVKVSGGTGVFADDLEGEYTVARC